MNSIRYWRIQRTLEKLYHWKNREDAAYHRVRFSGLFGGKYGMCSSEEAFRDYEYAARKVKRLSAKFERLTRGRSP